jgi:DNA polymerase-3 subunit alpha
MIDYVSLHNHTSFSIMQALVSPNDLFERCAELGQTAVAVTDLGTLSGLWDSYKASKKHGVKLIVGCEFYFVNNVADKEAQLRHIVLIAKNAVGYKNLLLLNKKGYDNFIVAFKRATPRIDWKLLEEHSEGLICTTACGNGIISQLVQKQDYGTAKDQLTNLKRIFGDNLAVELQPHSLVRKATAYSGDIDQNHINIQLAKLAQELDVRCIVATDVHYLYQKHHAAHDVLLAIGSGQPIGSGNRLKYNVKEFYVKSFYEVAQYFIRLGSIWKPDFIESLFKNTIFFADQCEDPAWIDPKFTNPSGKELPEFPVKNQPDYDDFVKWKNINATNLDEDVAYLRYWCETQFLSKTPPGKEKQYRERLNEELDVIEFHGFSSYMLIVADYIRWAKENGVRVGPGRGSVGGSLIGYLIGIHQADPIKYKLVFARFHNKEKTSFPDIDVDFTSSGREMVQNYIRRKYGEDYVAHVSNINTITPKVFIKDISRTFEFGGDRTEAAKIGQQIADLVTADIRSIQTAAELIPLFDEYTKQFPELLEYSEQITHMARAWSTHAAGLIIAKRPLTGLVPVRRDKDGSFALEYDKDRAEENGLVKMDTLGLETLDIIDTIYDLIKKSGKISPKDPIDYEEYDEKTYNLISGGNTFGVFQLASTAVPVCKSLRPKHIMDISNITALVRPSAESFRDDFIKVHNGQKEIDLLHPALENAFKDTNGYGLYEECLIYLAHDIAGWNLHEADSLRKITKDKGKNPQKVKKAREKFISDAQTRKNFSKEDAEMIWDNVVAEFGGYGFNISHALLYSILTYQTAYLKAHYPLEFLVANLMSEVKSNAKQADENIIKIKNEVRHLGVKIIAPDLNTSEMSYKIIDDNTLMTGLDSLKYMGNDAIPEILSKRPFSSFEDFLMKIDGKKVRSTAIQALAASGSLDCFGISRKLMFLYASDFKKKFQVYAKKSPEKRGEFLYPWPNETEWSVRELFALEEFYLGEGLSGTVNERYDEFFKNAPSFLDFIKRYEYVDIKPDEPLKTKVKKESFEKRKRNINTFSLIESGELLPRAIITNVFSFKVKKEGSSIFGQVMARLMLQDAYGNELPAVAFPTDWQNIQDVIEELSAGKHKISTGLAIKFKGSFYRENEHTSQFIITDISGYKAAPELPKDLKSKKVKMPRASRSSKKEIEKLSTKELAEELEDELIEDGVSTIDSDEDEYDDLAFS